MRTLTVILPADVAQRVEELAAEQNRSVDDVVVRAIDIYESERARLTDLFARVNKFSETYMRENPDVTEADVARWVKEVRAEKAGKNQAA